MNIKLFILGILISISLDVLAQNKYKLEFDLGTEFRRPETGTLLFQSSSPVKGVSIDAKFFKLNEGMFIHGPDFSYTLVFKNLDYINDEYFRDREAGFPPERWLPDTVSSMSIAHQISLSYNFGLEKILKEKHSIFAFAGIGGVMYMLPKRIDQFQGEDYEWENNLFGVVTRLNFGYGYLLNPNTGIQISAGLNSMYLTKDTYGDFFGVSSGHFQFSYSLKLGLSKYF